jgi:hypothetical protein
LSGILCPGGRASVPSAQLSLLRVKVGLYGMAPCWAHQVLAMWHMYVRKAAAESAAPSGVSQGTSKREIRSCAIRDRPSSSLAVRPVSLPATAGACAGPSGWCAWVGHGTCAWIRVAAGTDKSSLWQGSGRLPLRPVRGLSALCRRLAAKSGARI